MGNELNIQDPENEQIGKLIGGLKHVNAPGDFDFKVRARIAKGTPQTASWFPASVRLAAPLALMLLVGGYFGFNALYSPKDADVPVVAEVPRPVIIPAVVPVANDNLPQRPSVINTERAEVKPVQTEDKAAVSLPEKGFRETSATPPGGGSIDMGASVPRKILPRGFESNVKVTSSSKTVQIPAKDILNIIGIDAAYTESGWKVRSVSSNNVAGRSGVKAGDVIEAVDEQTLSEKTSFGGKFSGKSLRVRRDGATVKIELKP